MKRRDIIVDVLGQDSAAAARLTIAASRPIPGRLAYEIPQGSSERATLPKKSGSRGRQSMPAHSKTGGISPARLMSLNYLIVCVTLMKNERPR